jgi:hypothetical protein
MRLALSSAQRQQIAAAALALHSEARLTFINDVGWALGAKCHGRAPTSGDVERAINDTLDATPFWPKSVFLCDAATTKEAPMSQTNRRAENLDDDFELVNGKKMLRDGRRFRNPVLTMDSDNAPPRVAPRGHRPGFAFRDGRMADERRQAYLDYEKSLTGSYLRPTQNANTGQGSRGPVETRKVGDVCIVQGQNGHLYESDGGELVCVPDGWGDAAFDDRAMAQAEYLDRVSNAWRNPHGDVVQDRGPVQRADAALTRDELYAAYDQEIAAAYRNVKP